MKDEPRRPRPDDLLRQIETEGRRKQKGRLKIFLGYAAGVGKTYAMLDDAHMMKKLGRDVVAGYIEPHARPDTIAMLDGLEQLPLRKLAYRQAELYEFDLDAALARKPDIILVDELAHTNAAGSRHAKRYQDIEELLRAGIDVLTTVNIQHLESLNDLVASIAKIQVNERIPDFVFDNAYQVELVDIEPDDLIQRLHEGKIYRAPQAERALQNFFLRENLIALREIALRRTADRVSKESERERTSSEPFYTNEHILICLSSAPSSTKVIRAAARMASAFRAAFTALYVETPTDQTMSEYARERLKKNMRLAEEMGAKIVTVFGEDVPEQIAEYAKASKVSKLVMGRSITRKSWLSLRQSFVEHLTAIAPNLDIFIIPDAADARREKRRRQQQIRKHLLLRTSDIAKILAILSASTALGLLFFNFGFREANIITIFILGVLLIATVTRGYLNSIIASILGVLTFNFFFTEPRFSFVAYDASYPITFLIMLAASFITSTLTTRVTDQAVLNAKKSHRTEILLETIQALQKGTTAKETFQIAAMQMKELTDHTIIVYEADGDSLSSPVIFAADAEAPPSAQLLRNASEESTAKWVLTNRQAAGVSTGTLPQSAALYLPVFKGDTAFGVIGIQQAKGAELPPFERSLIGAMVNELSIALEAFRQQEGREWMALQAERERLRANLLRAVSHDLRTPLTSISGNANILLASGDTMDPAVRRKLYEDVYEDAMWLINLVENLLSVTRIDNGDMALRLQPELVQDIIDEALRHTSRRRNSHSIGVRLPDDLLMAKVDARLVIQVLVNVVDNAIKYTPAGCHIEVAAYAKGDSVILEVADDGPGIPDEMKPKLFDMFFTTGNNPGDLRRGLGIGLSLCQSIVQAHGGAMYVRDNAPRGAVFGFTLQRAEVTPADSRHLEGVQP